jgi:Ser/Thr protein kinase RdoA (MazF antagonist)
MNDNFKIPIEKIENSYPFLKNGKISILSGGLINKTYKIDLKEEKYVLQWVNPIFPKESTDDVNKITQFLKNEGLPTFTIKETLKQKPYVETKDGIWRVLTYLEGVSGSSKDIPESAQFLGKFHKTLSNFDYIFKHNRDIHNTKNYLIKLKNTLIKLKYKPLFTQVEQVSERIFEILNFNLSREHFPQRIVHGDPKLENFIITPKGPCLIDMDTVGKHDIIGEIGDTVRSWCRIENIFSIKLFELFFNSYFKGSENNLEPVEIENIFIGILTISLELTCRFLIDTLEESYFAWDSQKFKSSGLHNFFRAKNEFKFSLSVLENREKILKIINQKK